MSPLGAAATAAASAFASSTWVCPSASRRNRIFSTSGPCRSVTLNRGALPGATGSGSVFAATRTRFLNALASGSARVSDARVASRDETRRPARKSAAGGSGGEMRPLENVGWAASMDGLGARPAESLCRSHPVRTNPKTPRLMAASDPMTMLAQSDSAARAPSPTRGSRACSSTRSSSTSAAFPIRRY